MASSSGNVKVEIHGEDKTANKWSVALGEEVFWRFLSGGGGGAAVAWKVFGEGSLFSPFLFGKYFDPSDAFPLWEFESEVLLSHLRSSGQCKVNWFQTDHAYVLKAELPGNEKNNVRVYVDKGKVVEISGQWKQQTQGEMNNKKTTGTKDWRSGQWWECGYVRRLELPGDGDTSAADAFVSSDDVFEIRIPKDTTHDATCKRSESLPR
ncbi:PREDICTED: 21.7 kDa class VI heat shock protein [Tarenaya hassleriana]|uniref:21.7 kDa class VI heat shock protein n=1 Tax=Tarenaya hassleriana TaxID=28532 RepID=UPI00053C9942|nr:PREDICTED: 21.7 kDa class VI heat shock protein [Tarenaya hassleriana]